MDATAKPINKTVQLPRPLYLKLLAAAKTAELSLSAYLLDSAAKRAGVPFVPARRGRPRRKPAGGTE